MRRLQQLKAQNKKIVCLTAYDYFTAKILDECNIDLILVGDSLANVFLGLSNTYDIGIEELVYHTKAVAKAVKNSLLVADMPFASYQVSPEQAFINASLLIKAGAKAVKIETGNSDNLKAVIKLTAHGIPVIGHVGYTPQSCLTIGKNKIQGKTQSERERILKESLGFQEAGAKAIVLELIPEDLAREITEALEIPTIGIGCGKFCDGQVLVSDDMLGKTDSNFKFLKKYADIAQETRQAVLNYSQEVRESRFPD